MMKSAVVVSFCLLTVVTAVTEDQWHTFQLKFGRKYKSPTEEYFRKKIFLNNVMLINQQNQRYAEGKSTFTMGINQFADLTTQEYKELMNNYQMSSHASNNGQQVLPTLEANGTAVDWRTSGCVTAVKDQGQCGSCWAFSATGSTEFVSCISSGTLVSLSEQNLIDCTYSYGNLGCNGGAVDSCFEYIIDNNGIETEESYPYIGNSNDSVCHYNYTERGASLSAFSDVLPIKNENSLLNSVILGVVSAAIDASQPSFQLYSSGVYDEPLCSSDVLDHAVLVVGYGTDAVGGDYWLVKNSWGTSWGEAGYINMARNKNNQCGIATQASYPIV